MENTILYNIFFCLGFLNSHNIYSEQTKAAFYGTIISLILSIMFIYKLELGVYGLAITLILTRFSETTYLLIITKNSEKMKNSLFWFKKESFKECFNFLWEVSAIVFIVFMGYFFDDIYLYLSGYFTSSELSTHLIYGNTLNLIKMIAEGFSCTITTYVGNSMGAGNAVKSKGYSIFGIIILYFLLLIAILLLILFRESFF